MARPQPWHTGGAPAAPEYCIEFAPSKRFGPARRIPKRMHRVLIAKAPDGGWVDACTEAEDLIDFRAAADAFVATNPDFTLSWWYHDDCERYLAEHFDPILLWTFRKHVAYACKADLMRLVILYREGGFYGDLKHYTLASLSDAFGDAAGCIGTQWFSACQDGVFMPAEVGAGLDPSVAAACCRAYDYEAFTAELDAATRARETKVALMQNGFLGAAAGHPFLKLAIAEAVSFAQAADHGDNPWEPSGPTLLMRAIASYFGDGLKLGRHLLFERLTDAATAAPLETASAYALSVRQQLPYDSFATFGRFVHAPPELIEREVYQIERAPGTPLVLVSHKGVFEAARRDRLRRARGLGRQTSTGPGAGWRGLGGNNYLALWCERRMYVEDGQVDTTRPRVHTHERRRTQLLTLTLVALGTLVVMRMARTAARAP